MINLPSAFKITVKTIKKSISNSVGTVNMYDSSNNTIGFGSFGSNNTSYSLGYQEEGSWSLVRNVTLSLNTEYLWEYVYDNGESTCIINGNTLSLSKLHSTVKLSVGLSQSVNLIFKDLLIMPL